MLGVDVGGTFTDVVSVRDGRDRGDEGPERRRPSGRRPSSRARGGSGVEGQTVFNHASTMGLNAVITRRLPKVALPHDRGPPRHARPRPRVAAAGRADRPELAPLVRRRRRPLVPRYLRRGVRERLLADGSVLLPLDEEQARARSSRCSTAATSRASRSACSTPTSTRRTSSGCASWPGRSLGDVAVSISSETSPLAKEYARASTTVIDVFMKLIFTELRARARRGPARARLRRRAQLRRLRRDADALGGGAQAAVPDRLRRPRRGHGLEHRASARRSATATSSAATSAAPPPTSRSSSTGSRSSTTRSSSSTT